VVLYGGHWAVVEGTGDSQHERNHVYGIWETKEEAVQAQKEMLAETETEPES
jgi:hypothetical protein